MLKNKLCKFGENVCLFVFNHKILYNILRKVVEFGMKEFVCENCGKTFLAEPSHRKHKHVFCSMKCQHEWRTGKTGLVKKKGVYKTCPVCGNKFYCYPCEVDIRKTCSVECKNEYERINGTNSGENCNFWRGGFDSYRGKNWYHQRQLALKRDGNKCAICGKTAKEQGYNMIVHHIVPFRFFDNDYERANDLDNLICLCHNCHAKQESHRWTVVPEEYKYLLKGVTPKEKPPSGRRYTEEEIQYIKDNFDDMTYDELARIMGRPKYSVIDKAANLGLKKTRRSIFSKEEVKIIEENYPFEGESFFKEKIPDKTYKQIASYCQRNKIYKHDTERSHEETSGTCRD